jgi:hypothetical protein
MEPGNLTVEWDVWEEAPEEDGLVHIGIDDVRPEWSGGGSRQELELPAAATSSGPLSLESSMYELQLAFGQVRPEVIGNVLVNTVAYTENEVTFLTGPESTLWVGPLSGDTYFLTPAAPWQYCQAFADVCGGDLLTIASAEQEAGVRTHYGTDEQFWIGLNNTGGGWTWSSGAAVTYQNWAPGEPNGWPPSAAVMNSTPEGQWSDEPTNSMHRGIVVIPWETVAAPPDDHGNTFDDATPTTVPSTTIAYLGYPGDVDLFSFDAAAGQSYEIVVDLPADGLEDSTLWLYDADGVTLLAWDDDGGQGDGSRILWTASTAGTYYLAVDAEQAWDTGLGAYSLEILTSSIVADAPAATVAQPAELVVTCRDRGVAIAPIYVGATSADEGCVLHLLDLTDPLAPVDLGGYFSGGLDGWAFDSTGQFLYLVDDSNAWPPLGPGYSELIVLDVSGTGDPVEVCRIPLQQIDSETLRSAGNYLYVGSQPADKSQVFLEIYDVSNPAVPVLVGQTGPIVYGTQPDMDPDMIAVNGGVAYVLHESRVVSIIDVVNPARPLLLGQYELPVAEGEDCWWLTVVDEILLASCGWQLHVADVSDPATPLPLADLDMGGQVGQIVVQGERAYVGVAALGVVVVDLSVPTSPSVIQQYVVSGAGGGAAIHEEYLLVLARTSIAVFDAGILPHVVGYQPTHVLVPPVSSVTFTFDRPMDQTSFSLDPDVVSFTGPAEVLTATGYVWADDYYSLQVTFDPQTAPGMYELVLGPEILADGTPLDQDGDGGAGELLDDRVVASFEMEPVCEVFLGRRIDYGAPGTEDDHYEYGVRIGGRLLQNVEIVTPWSATFASADCLPPTWPGGDFSGESGNAEFETGMDEGIPWISVGWEPDSSQWSSLDSGGTGLVVFYAGGTWTGTVNFTAVTQPSQEPVLTNPAHGQSDVELVPLIQWQAWESGPVGTDIELRLIDTVFDDNLYERLLAPEGTSWQVPDVLEPNRVYEVELDFSDHAVVTVNDVEANVWAGTESDSRFTTTSFGLGEVWIYRGIDYGVPGYSNDNAHNCEINLRGAGITNIALTTPWGQVVESSPLVPESWNGQDDVELHVGPMYFDVWPQDGLTEYALGWDWLTDSQWASLDMNPTLVTVSFGNGGTWEAELDFSQVYQTEREPNPITPLHRQAESGSLTVAWDLWEDAPEGGIVHIGLQTERPPWGGGVDWDEEFELPSSATSYGPIAVPSSLYRLELDFGEIEHAIIGGALVNTVAYTANDITFQAGPMAPEDDHANSFDEATGVSVSEVVAGELSYPGDLDFFSFEAVAGQTYEILVELPPDGLEVSALWLYDTDGQTLLLSDKDGGHSGGSRIVWTAPADGTYYFAVDAEELWDDLGGYTVQISETDLLGEAPVTAYEETTDYILTCKDHGVRVVSTYTGSTSEEYAVAYFLDLSDPLVPEELGAYYLRGIEGAVFHPSGQYLYLADDSNNWLGWGPGYSEIVVLDLSGEGDPVEVNRVRIQQTDVDSIVLAGEFLYVGSQYDDGMPEAHLEVYSISDPANPVFICQSATLTWPGPGSHSMDPEQIVIDGTRAILFGTGFASRIEEDTRRESFF